MKKFFITSLCLSSMLFAASNEEIIKFYSQIVQTQLPKAKVSIIKRQKVQNSDIESVELKISSPDGELTELLFTKDKFIFPELIDIKEGISYRQEFEMNKFQEAKLAFEKKALAELKKEKLIISLGDKNKPKMYVFSDPECPYCRQHLANIEAELKTHQIDFVFTPVHDKSAFEKSALIYKESKNAKSDAEKIAIFRKYFDPKLQNYPKVSEQELKQMTDLFSKYQKLGLRAVPAIINDK
ncbi:hypothetical protein DMB92_00090 [Campylobacter sp. MIT 99-7217]|uniref:thioredoxin fold domain-containing protein n=1 Tax=Campylobacter sp. MIT 99-7217 TaxID=535091 RepID=UPI00115BDE03|nr:thioredoxin fold domain-containing protein [Campylobacter sp. MIT 99-7217]TQR34405.1 hypothetical protein DMB92_00090 [Campylobacter sp. MIT 99-7217]